MISLQRHTCIKRDCKLSTLPSSHCLEVHKACQPCHQMHWQNLSIAPRKHQLYHSDTQYFFGLWATKAAISAKLVPLRLPLEFLPSSLSSLLSLSSSLLFNCTYKKTIAVSNSILISFSPWTNCHWGISELPVGLSTFARWLKRGTHANEIDCFNVWHFNIVRCLEVSCVLCLVIPISRIDWINATTTTKKEATFSSRSYWIAM